MDIYTIIFLVIAVVVILRLRSVLGRRTGNERPPSDIFQGAERRRTNTISGPDGKLAMPRPQVGDAAVQIEARAADNDTRMRDFLPIDSPAAPGLIAISRADAGFDPGQFVQGARIAYERIVVAFALGDLKTLKTLLSKEVFDGFQLAVNEREKRGESVDTDFVGIDRVDIIEAETKNKTAQITVKFVSQLISAVTNKSGEIIEGDPKKVREMTDVWTFARETTSRDPNWKLIATRPAN